jgi:hypothetical protein
MSQLDPTTMRSYDRLSDLPKIANKPNGRSRSSPKHRCTKNSANIFDIPNQFMTEKFDANYNLSPNGNKKI